MQKDDRIINKYIQIRYNLHIQTHLHNCSQFLKKIGVGARLGVNRVWSRGQHSQCMRICCNPFRRTLDLRGDEFRLKGWCVGWEMRQRVALSVNWQLACFFLCVMVLILVAGIHALCTALSTKLRNSFQYIIPAYDPLYIVIPPWETISYLW